MLPRKPPVAQLLKNFPAFSRTRLLITVFTRALNWSLSWARTIHCISKEFVQVRHLVTVYFFCGEELLTPRPATKLEDHPLRAVRSMFAATVQIWRPSPPSATRRRPAPWWSGTHLTWLPICTSNVILTSRLQTSTDRPQRKNGLVPLWPQI
jgi:hypothetical protein